MSRQSAMLLRYAEAALSPASLRAEVTRLQKVAPHATSDNQLAMWMRNFAERAARLVWC